MSAPTLLMVDDDRSVLLGLRWIFQSLQLRLLTAGSALEGLDIYRRELPDVVILDINLPDLSGLEAYRRLRALDVKTPVIFLTGEGTTDTAIEGPTSHRLRGCSWRSFAL